MTMGGNCWSRTPGLYLLLLLSCLARLSSQYDENKPPLRSMCESVAYRDLPISVQNEHQCLVLEQLTSNTRNDVARKDAQLTDIIARLGQLDSKVTRGLGRLTSKLKISSAGSPGLKDIPVTGDCNELRVEGVEASGVYPIMLSNGELLNVYCDMLTDGGGWTVIQQRGDGTVNFTRKWNDYAFGFGNVNTEYWLGNEHIHSMTKSKKYSLRVDLWDWNEKHAFAEYEVFNVDTESQSYRLTVEGFSENSTAGDSLVHHNGMKFTTIDRDNDQWWANCAMKDRSGWWFNQCSYCSLNGVYHHEKSLKTQVIRKIKLRKKERSRRSKKRLKTLRASEKKRKRSRKNRIRRKRKISPDGTTTGITWFEWKKKPGYSLMRVQMKIKPLIAVRDYHQQPVKSKNEAVFN